MTTQNRKTDFTSRELVTAALTFQETPRIPIDSQFTPEGTQPSDVVGPPYRYGKGAASGVPCKKGTYADAWGCRWEAGEDGVSGEVKDAPMDSDNWEGYVPFEPPYSVLVEADDS